MREAQSSVEIYDDAKDAMTNANRDRLARPIRPVIMQKSASRVQDAPAPRWRAAGSRAQRLQARRPNTPSGIWHGSC